MQTFAATFVGTEPSDPAPSQLYLGRMEDVVVTPSKLRNALSKLDGTSASGLDEVNPYMLKACADQFVHPLCVIFEKSLRSVKLPQWWSKSLVLPLYKAKSRCDPSNYQPVSLTSVCCKSMKRVIATELDDYLESCGLFSSRQFGFPRGWSVEDQLLLVYSEVALLVDKSFVVDMILLNFSKAFDVVSHTLLLQKLRTIGINASLLN